MVSASAPDSWAAALEARSRWVPWIVFFLGILALAPSIGSETSLTGSDEYTLSLRTPMEMLERGDWLTPWVNGEPRLRKPPLLYWLTLANYQLFGVGLVPARIWGVLSGAGLAVGACLLARELYRTTGFLAGLLTLSCLGVAAQARMAMLDLPLGLLVSLALLQGIRWVRTQRLKDALLASVWLGLSFLMKGPVGIFFFAAGAAAALSFPTGSALRRHWTHWFWALLLLLAIIVPWPLAMQRLWADRFVKIVGEELAARDFGGWHGKSPLSALGGALGLIAPWTPFVVGAVWQFFCTPKAERDARQRWLILAFLFSVLPFFFMRAFERYMLAVVPIQAVLGAQWISQQGPWRKAALRFSAIVLSVVLIAGSGAAIWFHLGLWPPMVVLVITAAMLWESFGQARPIRVVMLATVLLTLGLGAVYPLLGLNYLPTGIERQFAGRPVFTYELLQPAMLSPRLGRSVQPWKPEFVERDRPVLVFVERSMLPRFQSAIQESGLTVKEEDRFKTFWSRKTWVRFAREDATGADWLDAVRARSLDRLRTEITLFEVRRPRSS
ncbi:MAG: glycosyltransferase family 39 protein [Verrucomicrobiota bacterium]